MNFAEGEILLINKPLRWTSFDVVNKIRYTITKKTGQRLKVGHAGTLDPMASGLLILCTGKKTKELTIEITSIIIQTFNQFTNCFQVGGWPN